MERTYIAGEDIRRGQLLYAETVDADTSEPLTLVYRMIIGKTPVGLAMTDGQKDQPVSVAVSGGIMDMKLDDDLFGPHGPQNPNI
jgi:hypothetical protein